MRQGAAGSIFDPPPREMSRAEFVKKFGGVYEHFPEIAAAAFDRGLTTAEDTPAGLAAAMASVAAALGEAEKLALIRNHPDLAGKAAIAGELTEASRSEQARAGLANCTPEEFRRFQELNAAYKQKFGFPFILAVGGRHRREILAAFEVQIERDRDLEFRTALAEIDKIARLRLEAMAR
ncbi:MAG: 2-oxo-4-hydroxy-4-carboxy-5-ureidoimidazoline decarboxylase [Propylenella sp.]